MKLKRVAITRIPKKRVLIIGDGKETEPNYFRGLCREQSVRKRFVVHICRWNGGIAQTTIDEAKARQELASQGPAGAYDELWCFVDVETGSASPSRQDRDALARNEKLHVVLSNPCFEVWVLAHFDRMSRPFLNCAEVCSEVEKRFVGKFGSTYDKTDHEVYSQLQLLTQDAIKNARDVLEKDHMWQEDAASCNSCTEVYRYVESLLTGNSPSGI